MQTTKYVLPDPIPYMTTAGLMLAALDAAHFAASCEGELIQLHRGPGGKYLTPWDTERVAELRDYIKTNDRLCAEYMRRIAA